MIKKYLFPMYLVLLGSLFYAGSALGQSATFPKPKDDYINDYAKVLKPIDSESIQKILRDVRAQTGIEATLVTINTLGDYGAANQSLEWFATELFNTWGIGKKDTNNGILILFALKDRKIRIELGSGYAAYYDSVMQQIIDEKMIPHFKGSDYSRGLYEGVQAVITSITTPVAWYTYYKMPLIIGGLILLCLFIGISCLRSGKKGWGWIFLLIAGGLIIFLIKVLGKGKSGGGGFGGGRSRGGGASGSW